MFLSSIAKWFADRGERSAPRRAAARLGVESLEGREVPAVNIVLNYSLDSFGFFSDPARRAVLDKAATMIESRLNDTLDAVTPSGTNSWTPYVTNPATGLRYTLSGTTSIPADTIVVYAGGRDLPTGQLGIGGGGGYSARGTTTWFNAIKGRGEAGALATPATDYAPWGGSITFDTVGTRWHVGDTTAGLESTEVDFLSVAMHELGHVVGLGTAGSWQRLTSTGAFTGAAATAEYGRAVPLDGSRGHFAEGTLSDGIEAAMDPSITVGTRKLFGDLDFAAMKDIGWEVTAANDTISQAKTALNRRTAAPTAPISVSFADRIGTATDVNVYRVYLGPNVKLTAKTSASGTPVDTYLKLYDASGTLLASANQGGTGGTDTLSYTSTRGDYYYIAVSSVGNQAFDPFRANSGPGGSIGDYLMSVTLQ